MALKNLAGKASFHLARFLLFTARFVPVPSPAGPALLAKRIGVPIIPAYVCRDKDNFHHITILPELPLRQEDDHEKFMTVNTQMLLDWIAEILIRHPAEWLWLHNRWKRARKE